MEPMIAVSGLTKRFGPITAVDDITLAVGRGEVLGFLGPNGAGKSTTMRMITGFLTPTAGSAVVCGHDVVKDPIAVQRRIGYMPEGAPLYGDITPAAFLDFVAGARGFTGAERRQRIAAAVDKLEIAEVLNRPIETLSKGYKRRTGLAQALLHDPEVLILDEPTDGLDPNQKHQVRSLIRSMGRNKAIVISTHILEEVEAACTRAVIIARGRVVFDGSPEELRRRSARHNAVSIRLRREHLAKAEAEFARLPGVARVEVIEAAAPVVTLLAIPADGRPIIQEVSEKVRASGFAIDGLHVEQGQLDEVFRQLTTRK